MLTLNKPVASSQNDDVQIHVRLLTSKFFQCTAAQSQTLSDATGMTHAPFVEFFATMLAENETHAWNSPLHQAFKHSFPDKQIVVNPHAEGVWEKVRIVQRTLSREEAISIIGDLVERCQHDYTKLREVQSYANMVDKAQPETYVHWIRLARLAANGDELDQIHLTE